MNKKILGLLFVMFISFFIFGISTVKALTCGYGGTTSSPEYTVTVVNNEISVTGAEHRDVLKPEMFVNGCISNIYVNFNPPPIKIAPDDRSNATSRFALTSVNGVASGTNQPGNNNPPPPPIDDMSLCSGGRLSIFRFIGRILMVLRIVIPIIIIVLGSIDFGKAVAVNDEDAIKKSTNTLIRRIIAGVAIFFLPTLVYLVFNFVPGLNNTEATDCARCLARPNSC